MTGRYTSGGLQSGGGTNTANPNPGGCGCRLGFAIKKNGLHVSSTSVSRYQNSGGRAARAALMERFSPRFKERRSDLQDGVSYVLYNKYFPISPPPTKCNHYFPPVSSTSTYRSLLAWSKLCRPASAASRSTSKPRSPICSTSTCRSLRVLGSN